MAFTAGAGLSLESVHIDGKESDFAFESQDYYVAVNNENHGVVVMHIGGVTTEKTNYLGTFTFRADAETRGPFSITLDEVNTYFLSPAGQVIDLNPETR